MSKRNFSAPGDTCIYAVGDIHGRVDLLEKMHALILSDLKGVEASRRLVIYLGDYIDRGPDSPKVIDHLLDHPLAGMESIHLMGNHEDFLLGFLHDGDGAASWLVSGGEATVKSYGGKMKYLADDRQLAEMRQHLLKAIPQRHQLFVNGLKLHHREGDYIFVHAGLKPGVPFDQQDDADFMWIRNEFLSSDLDHGGCVIHGHSMVPEPVIRPNRIGIDTGAYASGVLTAAVLEGTKLRFLHT